MVNSRCLNRFRDINSAVEHFYSHNLASQLPKTSASTSVDTKQATALFQKYAKNGEMADDEIEKFY